MTDPQRTVLDEAARHGLGPFVSSTSRRPGVPGALICLALLIVGANFAVNGPYNAFGWTVMGTAVAVPALWAYVWARRVYGGLYVFQNGMIDRAGRRSFVLAWTDVVAVTVADTGYAIGGLPVGSSTRYTIAYRLADRPAVVHWYLNGTYAGVDALAADIARRAGVAVTRETAPR